MIRIILALLASYGLHELHDPSGATLGITTSPPAHYVCCADRRCHDVSTRVCGAGEILHECSDTLQCNADGSACWYDCWPVPMPNNYFATKAKARLALLRDAVKRACEDQADIDALYPSRNKGGR